MFKKFLIVLIVSAFVPFNMNAEWVSLDKNSTSGTSPKVTLLSDDNNSTVIKVDISGFDLKEFQSEGKTYQSVDLLSDIFTARPGCPELPYISKVLAIPDRAGISVEVIETGEVRTFKNIQLKTALASWFAGKENPHKESTAVYRSSGVYPTEFASVEPPSVFRDFRIARVSIFPVRYVADKKELQVVSSITVRINYGKGEVVNPKTTSRKAIAPSFAKLYRSFIFNYREVLNNRYNGEETGREKMLCIMPDDFVNSFQPYADWKLQSGTDVHITKFSDIGATASNPGIIKNHITDAYHNWEHPPTYVLLVGDAGVFPRKTVHYDYSFANEDYFVEIDGNDFFPEMMIGRITNQNDYQLQVMVNKFMKYEKEPHTADTSWFKKGICCSNNDYPSQVETKRFTTNVMMEDGGFTSVDTLMSDGYYGGNCSMDLNDILNAINDGRSHLNYRGEGWTDGWWANCYSFNTYDVSSLNNGEKLTFVTSIGCGVAMFDESGGNCFGEEWLQLGSVTSPRGAVAFVGPGSNTHTTYNNRIDKGIYVGMFREGMDTPGQALLRGKLYMYNVFGTDPWVEYHYRVFYVLGDPSIHIWKDVPLEVNVVHPTSVPVGYSQPEFTVTFAASGLPVANAQVCLSGDDVFATGFTDSTGTVFVGITPTAPGTLSVTVRGGNVIPYQGTMDIVQTAEHVGPESYPIIVDIDGNTDGLINPNENCNITFTLKNWGTQTANNVQATLSAAEPNLVEIITTGPVSFGDLASGGSNTGDPFQFHVLPDCPVGETITLELHVTSTTSSWDYRYNEDVMGCRLRYVDCVVNDEGSTNTNYRMDPGETVKLFLSIVNIGEDVAPDVMGILRTDDQYITIDDSIGSFGSLDTGAVAMNDGNYYVVSVDASCPTDYLVEYSLRLYTQNGNYPYETVCYLTIPVAMPVPGDFTGPDAYGYYAYSHNDTLFEQAPVYEWFEISGFGTEVDVPLYESDHTVTVDVPFTFKYYGVDYDELRVSTDGWIAFGNGAQTAPTNYALPHNDNVNCMVAAFWDDLYDTYYEEGEIYYFYDNINHRFIIEWDDIAHNEFSWPPKTEIFQAMLLDPAVYPTATGDGEIIVQYKKVTKSSSNTIGIENHSQDVGLQYVYNSNYDATAATLNNGTAIKFTTEAPVIIVSVDEDMDNGLVHGDSNLGQNYPNPFSSHTSINYSVPEQSNVTLCIYNIRGGLVRTLHDGRQTAGKYSVTWNGFNDSGNRVGSGIYVYRLQTDNFIESKKLFMLK